MRAVDTNVLARFIMADDEAQYLVARDVMRTDVLVPVTVLLELCWVLTAFYRMKRPDVVGILANLLDMPNVHIAQEVGLRWAVARFGAGADFADMIHLVMAQDAGRFSTFDRDIARKAGDDLPLPVETLGLR